jgi:opacity protein-like surface antigen
MKKSLFSIMVAAVLAAVIAAAVSAAETAQAIQPSADEKADSQADKGHIDQADNACQKSGYDGYINNDCGYLP